MRYLLATLLLLVAVKAQAAPSFDAIATIDDNSGTASPSVTLNVGGACANRIIIAVVSWWQSGGPGSVSSMLIGGSAATFINGVSPASGTNNRRIELWYRVGVTTGSNTITATMDAVKDVITISGLSYCGVHQSVALGTSATADNMASNALATVDVSSAADELVVDAMITGSAATSITPSQTSRLNDTTWTTIFLSGISDQTGSGTTTATWTANTDDYTGIVSVPLKPAAGGAPALVRRRPILIQ